jgi:CDP-2,3-bis-(O-geranylgeranyl)-sn-glycerol synthase
LESIIISFDSVIIALVAAFWIMLPAYVPNPVAAAAGGGRPIDGGKYFSDGRRIFGDGKTYRGFIIGILAGIIVGIFQIFLQTHPAFAFLPVHTYLSVFLFSFGALLGDLLKSFFKRRLGKERGEKWMIADQYDLVAGAFLLAVIFDYSWVISTITLPILVFILILTPVLHRAMNIIGYIAGVKDVPW